MQPEPIIIIPSKRTGSGPFARAIRWVKLRDKTLADFTKLILMALLSYLLDILFPHLLKILTPLYSSAC